VPFSEVAWKTAKKALEAEYDPRRPDPYEAIGGTRVVRAVQFFILCRQSLAGRMSCFAGITQTRLRQRMNEQAAAWWSAVDGLPLVHERLKRVVILNRDALEVIEKFNRPDVVQYLDPPYPPDTRESANVYDFEMSLDQHKKMLDVVLASEAKILLSSYANPLYEKRLKEWNRHVFDLPNNASHGKVKERKQEVVYANF